MAKLDTFKNPVTGQTGRLSNWRDWGPLLLGVIFLMFIWQLGSGLYQRFVNPLIPKPIKNYMGSGLTQARTNGNSNGSKVAQAPKPLTLY